VAFEEVDFERFEARGEASPEERALAAEAVARSAEALRSLKPQELRAFGAAGERASGCSYAEIQHGDGVVLHEGQPLSDGGARTGLSSRR